ncbi:MAG TPA: glycine cleavage system protein GcvH [Burkholderiaceae bacterium]
MDNPSDLKYTSSHEWLRNNGDGTVTVGITSHAQEALGELVYVELPESGSKLAAGQPFAVVESTKAASDVYSPVDGEVVEANAALADAPQSVNESPFDAGWLVRIRIADPKQLEAMLSAADYAAGPGAG